MYVFNLFTLQHDITDNAMDVPYRQAQETTKKISHLTSEISAIYIGDKFHKFRDR